MTASGGHPDPIEAWGEISARAARSGGVRRTRRGGAGAGWPLGVLVLAAVVVVAGLSLRQAGVASDPSPSASAGRDPLHLRADQLLAAWADDASHGSAVDFIGDLTGQTGDWEEPVGENNKRALMAGLLTAAEPLATDVPPDGDVRWADGDTVTVPLLSAARSLEDLATGAVDSCSDCTRLEVTGATLTTVAVETTRGPAVAPAWRFALAGTAVTVTRIAVIDATVPNPLLPLPQGQYPALQWIERAVGSASEPSFVVHFTGAPRPASEPCGADYTAEAVESSLAVVVIVTTHPNPSPASCRLVGADRTAAVVLASNLGDRAVIDIVQGMAVRLDPSFGPSPSAGQQASPAPSVAVPSALPMGSIDDGKFRLELVTPRVTYGPDEAIEPIARVTYLGPNSETSMYHGSTPVWFSIEEIGGNRVMGGGMDLPCLHTAIEKDRPLAYPFEKAGTTDDGFDRAWYADPILRLPTGTWRIRAYLEVDVTDGTATCGGENHRLDVENVVVVR